MQNSTSPDNPGFGTAMVSVVDQEGNLLTERVPNAMVARGLYANALRADLESRNTRNVAQEELDGVAPFDKATLAALGQVNRTNDNFRFMRLFHSKVMAALNDAVESTPYLLSCKTKYGSKMAKAYYSERLSFHLTKLIRGMEGYQSILNYLLHNFAYHGFAAAYFDDKDSWYWNAGGLDDFAFERLTKPDPKTLEIVFASRTLRVHELLDFIRDKETAKEAGWDPEVVEQVVKTASYSLPNYMKVATTVETMMKNNDLTMADMTSTSVPIVHMWVKEFDGTVTHSVFYEMNQQTPNASVDSSSEVRDDIVLKFMYSKKGAYESMEQAFVMFPYGTSTNGFIHSLRGFGNDILPQTKIANKLTCAGADAAMQNLSITLQATNEGARLDAAVNPIGNYTIIDGNFQVTQSANVNIEQGMGGVLNLMQASIRDYLGELDTQADGSMGKTQFETEVRLGNATRLSHRVQTRLMECLTKLFREIVRRVASADMDKSVRGFEEVQNMIEELEYEGVPKEALAQVDLYSVVATPAIGEGSPVQRKLMLREMFQYMQFLPKTGQDNLMRLVTLENMGPFLGDLIYPAPQTDFGQPNVEAIAAMQNNQMTNGMTVPVIPNEDHRVHADVHSNQIMSMIPEQELSKEEMAQLAPVLQIIVDHLAEHMQYLAVKKEIIPEFSQYEKLIKRCNEIITNGMRALEAMQQQEQAPVEGQEGMDTDEQIKMMKAQAEEDRKNQAFIAEQARLDRESQAEITRKQAEAADKMLRGL